MTLAEQMEAEEARLEQEARQNDREASIARKWFYGTLKVIIALLCLLMLNAMWGCVYRPEGIMLNHCLFTNDNNQCGVI